MGDKGRSSLVEKFSPMDASAPAQRHAWREKAILLLPKCIAHEDATRFEICSPKSELPSLGVVTPRSGHHIHEIVPSVVWIPSDENHT